MKKVSLDKYRTEGVKVLGGEQRGKVVAEEILRRHGRDVEIVIPDDIYAISTHFKAGFNSVLPNKLKR